jgi:adenosylmethionine-8-amino-7-oxononanoate aminotransferase
MEEDGSSYSTYAWHPRSTAAAIARLRWMTKNRQKLLANVERLSGYIRKRLRPMDFDKTAELTVCGLAIGVDVGSERRPSNIQEDARKAGLPISTQGSRLLLLPALNLPLSVAERGPRYLGALPLSFGVVPGVAFDRPLLVGRTLNLQNDRG